MIHLQVKLDKPFWEQKVFQRAGLASLGVTMLGRYYWMKQHGEVEKAIIFGMLFWTAVLYLLESYGKRDKVQSMG